MLISQYILKRQRINKKLKNMFNYPLIVVVAAMGYGKTTTVWDFLIEENIKFSWLSIEGDESSPQYIWDSLTRQLTKTMPEFGKQLRALGFPANTPQRDKVIKVFEDNTYMTNTVLVIDDYHFAHAPELDELIERIVRMNIDGLHILILTRVLPKINIEELSLKGYCYGIKSHLFELSEIEIKQYFQLFGQNISDDTSKKVYEISEGWVSAIYLIMQRYTEIGRLEPGRSIERLIETAVMSRYTEKEVMILKSLCILDSFTPEQGIYVTGDVETDRIIRRLSYENSFIRYNDQEDVYRIHNIFNNYLKQLIEEQPLKVELDSLYRRSGQWCIENNDILSGLKYLLKAKEYDLILTEFEKNRITEVIDSNPKYIIELFDKIPLEVKYRHPMGYIAYIAFYVTNIDKEAGQHILTQFIDYYMKDPEISPKMRIHIFGEIELIHSYICFNDIDEMIIKMKKAHGLLEGHSLIANKNKIITFGSPHILYLYYKDSGKMLEAVKGLEKLFPYYMEMSGGCGVGFDYQVNAEYFLETGELDEAERYAYKAIYKARTLDQISVIICSTLTLARILAAKGKFNKAQEMIDELSDEVEQCNSPILSSAFDLSMGYICGITEDDKSFPHWLKLGEIGRSEVLYQGIGFNYIIYGKYLVLNKEFIKLEILCEEMHHNFKPFNNQLGYLHTYILEAIAKYKLYGMRKARESILKAIEIGKEDNIILPFAEYSLHIKELIKELQKEIKGDKYISNLTKEIEKYAIALMDYRKLEETDSYLTNREKQVLHYVVEGKTNREIASILFIAEVTVRKNITSIYKKLDVTGRVEAAKKAIKLKII